MCRVVLVYISMILIGIRGQTSVYSDLANDVASDAASDVVINVTSSTFYADFTDKFSLNCSYPHNNQSQLSGVISIIVTKTADLTSTDYKEVAILSVLSGHGIEVKDDLGSNVEGQIALEGSAYISFEWKKPAAKVEGHYKCLVYGLDNEGHPITKTSEFDLESKPLEVPMALDKIQKLETSENLLKSQLFNTSALLNQTEEDLNQTIEDCHTLTSNLTSQLITSGQLLTSAQGELKVTQLNLDRTESILNSTATTLQTTKDELSLTSDTLKSVREVLLTNHNTLVYNRHYYVMSDLEKANVTKFAHACRLKGGYLLEINNAEEYQAVKDFVSRLSLGEYEIYLGLSDSQKEGEWRYMSSGGLATYTVWQPGQPDGNTGQNCAELYSLDMMMRDYDCVSSFNVRYICEVDCGNVMSCY